MKQQLQSNGQSFVYPAPSLFKMCRLKIFTPSSTRPVKPSLLYFPPKPSSTHSQPPASVLRFFEEEDELVSSFLYRAFFAAFLAASFFASSSLVCRSNFFFSEKRASNSSIPPFFRSFPFSLLPALFRFFDCVLVAANLFFSAFGIVVVVFKCWCDGDGFFEYSICLFHRRNEERERKEVIFDLSSNGRNQISIWGIDLIIWGRREYRILIASDVEDPLFCQ